MRPLPILTPGGRDLSPAELGVLKAAKGASGYEDLVLPRRAVQGSPGPILAVGVEPDWITDYALVPDLTDVGRVTAALTAILVEPDDPRLGQPEDLLSKWLDCDVTYVGEEEYAEPKQTIAPNGRAW